MSKVQTYLFYEVLRAVLIIVGGLAMLALLAQGLSRTDLILENRQSALTYFYIVMLGAPQVIALLTSPPPSAPCAKPFLLPGPIWPPP